MEWECAYLVLVGVYVLTAQGMAASDYNLFEGRWCEGMPH